MPHLSQKRSETMTSKITFALIISSAVCQGLEGQTLAPSQGITQPGMKVGPVNGSYALSEFETINVFNGKLNAAFPLLNIGGRGDAGYVMTVAVDYANWQVIPVNTRVDSPLSVQEGWQEVPEAGLSPGYLLRKSIGRIDQCASESRSPQILDTYTTYVLSRPGGGTMEFFPRDNPNPQRWNVCVTNEAGFQRGSIFITKDGSAATLVLTTPVVENSNGASQDGYKSGGDPTGYVAFKNGVHYNMKQGEVSWIVDRNGNEILLDYYPPDSTPRSVILNIASSVAQSLDVNLPATIGSSVITNLAQMTAWRVETRLHGFQLPAAGSSSVIYSSKGGLGPQLVLSNGNLAAILTEPGATAGCSLALSGHSDVVVRLQRDTFGQYGLQAWDYANPSASPPFATGTCPIGQSPSIDVSGLMSIGSDATRTGNALYRGRIAYVRLYATSTTAPAQPTEHLSGAALDYSFDGILAQDIGHDTANLQELTAYGSPTNEFSPGELGSGTGLLQRVTDSLGRAVDVSLPQETPVGSGSFVQTVSFKGFDNGQRTITIHSGPMTTTPATIGDMFGTLYTNAAQQYNKTRISTVQLPDGRSYGFTYNGCGEVFSVSLPTGSKMQYDWGGLAAGGTGLCLGAQPSPAGPIHRQVTERRLYTKTGSLESKTVYSRAAFTCTSNCGAAPTSNTAVGVRIQDTASVDVRIERHLFQGVPTSWRDVFQFPSWREGKEYRGEVRKTLWTTLGSESDTGTDFQSTAQTWKQYSATGSIEPAYDTAEDRPRVTRITTKLSEGGTTVMKHQRFQYNEYNNQIDSSESAWLSAPVPATRT